MVAGGAVIRGRVHRADGSAVPEARVFFVSAPVAVPDVALLTDDGGRFALYAPAPGRYEVGCHAEGLEPASVAIDVGESEMEVDVELRTLSDG
jgi:Carboxypeptidase regulatory-like domain